MKLFVGLDVSLAKTSVCVISEFGKIIKEAEVESEPELLARWLDDLDGSTAVIGLEAGPCCDADGNAPGERRAKNNANQVGPP